MRDEDVQARLADVYYDVFQVDLWVGSLTDDAVSGTQLGPLFTHFVTDQSTRTRAADDTFGDPDPALGDAIIADVNASSFATIIERNTDVNMVQNDVFITHDRSMTEQDSVDTTSRDDIVSLAAKTVNGSVYTQTGNDIVTLFGSSTINGDVVMAAGDGTFIATSGTILGEVRLGFGDDTVTLSDTANVQGGIGTNQGNDTVTLDDILRVLRKPNLMA